MNALVLAWPAETGACDRVAARQELHAVQEADAAAPFVDGLLDLGGTRRSIVRRIAPASRELPHGSTCCRSSAGTAAAPIPSSTHVMRAERRQFPRVRRVRACVTRGAPPDTAPATMDA